MIIKSKYAGRCYVCGDPYEIGDAIWWQKGDAPTCAACHETQTENAHSPIQPVQSGVIARFRSPADAPLAQASQPATALDYEETVQAIRESSDTQIPALLATCVEEAIKRGVFKAGGLLRFVGAIERKF